MNWTALLSLRVWGGAVLVGLIACFVLALANPILGSLGFLGGFGWTMYYHLTAGSPLICPHCRKRVKVGARTCRFCGRSTL